MNRSKTIWVDKHAYFFLRNKGRLERGCRPFTDEEQNQIWDTMTLQGYIKEGQYRLSDLSLGGGDGTYYGVWWNWSVDTLIEMLNSAKLKYVNGEPIEYISM